MTEVTILHANSYDGEEYALRLEIIETIPVTKRDKFSQYFNMDMAKTVPYYGVGEKLNIAQRKVRCEWPLPVSSQRQDKYMVGGCPRRS